MGEGKPGRKRPYTSTGIKRIPCCRCGKPAKYQWNCCALDNRWLGLCEDCDIKVNDWFLKFANVRDRKPLMERYKRRVQEEKNGT